MVERKNENLIDYYHEKVRLYRSLNLEIEDIKEQVMEDIYSRELFQYLMGRDHRDEDGLLCDIINFECMNEHRLKRIRSDYRQKTEINKPMKIGVPDITNGQ